MSQAFVKESDDQWLNDIPPTINALINYLSKENNGIRVYEKQNFINPATGKPVYDMSNGSAYAINEDGKWYLVE